MLIPFPRSIFGLTDRNDSTIFFDSFCPLFQKYSQPRKVVSNFCQITLLQTI